MTITHPDRAAMAQLAAECFRLRAAAAKVGEHTQGPALRLAARNIDLILRGLRIEAMDLAGQLYDAGMAVEVIDVEGGGAWESDGRYEIARTVTPLVLVDDHVALQGRVVLRELPPPPKPWQAAWSRRRNAKRARHLRELNNR